MGTRPPPPLLKTHWWSLWALSWQSRQVRVSQLSQNSTRGSCLCTLQYTVRSPSRDLAGPVQQVPPPPQGCSSCSAPPARGPHFLPILQPWATYWKNQRALQPLPGKSLGLETQILAFETLCPEPNQATPPSTFWR